MKYYLMVKNTATCEMSVVATFKGNEGDAYHVCSLLNEERKRLGDTVHVYGVTDNPMIWKG